MTKRLEVPGHVDATVRWPEPATTHAHNVTNMVMTMAIPLRVELPVYHLKCAIRRKGGPWTFDLPPGKYRCKGCGRILTVKSTDMDA